MLRRPQYAHSRGDRIDGSRPKNKNVPQLFCGTWQIL
jgi:hypothetical protein